MARGYYTAASQRDGRISIIFKRIIIHVIRIEGDITKELTKCGFVYARVKNKSRLEFGWRDEKKMVVKVREKICDNEKSDIAPGQEQGRASGVAAMVR